MTHFFRPQTLLGLLNALLILVPAGFAWAWLADHNLVGRFLPHTIVFAFFIVGLRWSLRRLAGKSTQLAPQAVLFAVMAAGAPAVGIYMTLIDTHPVWFAGLCFVVFFQLGWRAHMSIRRTIAEIDETPA